MEILTRQLENPAVTSTYKECLTIMNVYLKMDMEEHMQPLYTKSVLKGLCVAGSGTDDLDVRFSSLILAVWMVYEVSDKQECHLLKDDDEVGTIFFCLAAAAFRHALDKETLSE